MKTKLSLENLAGIKCTDTGLTSAEVASQRSRFGPNAIVERTGSPWLELLVDTVKDPMIWFLFVIGAAFYLVGDRQEALILFLATIPLVFMDAFLHWRTQASTASLKSQMATEAVVIRDGVQQRVDSQELVPGDLVALNPQDHFLPADGYWEQVDSLQVDESVLTGEAFPIAKRAIVSDWSGTKSEVLLEPEALGFAGTRVLTGTGLLRVVFTGKDTSYGEIIRSVASIAHERTALQQAIAGLTRNLIYAAAGFCLILALIRLYQGHGWLDAFLSAATLAVAAIPEEFPVVFTFFLGVGVYRLAKRRALVRRAVSVENIGRVTRICTDKTGTITVGQLKLTHVDAAQAFSTDEALLFAGVASNPLGTDPVDLAILSRAAESHVTLPMRRAVIPFTEDRKRESAFFIARERAWCVVKGSPETILAKVERSGEDPAAWLARTATWAQEGHKVLAVAIREVIQAELDRAQEPETGFQLVGLLAFEDPPRPEVRAAMSYCEKNGIKVLMITGDHPQTAAAIAKDVGLGGEHPRVLSAEAEPETFAESWLRKNPHVLRSADVIARCNPLQKLRIVEALKASGDLVAVTGDGVNDVPALKAADIGIAMGLRGSRSAREVASIILGDDNFSTIVNAIREGRQLFANLRLSFEYLLLFHIPFVLSAAVIPLLGYPLVYLPAHVVWLELIIHPTALFAFQQAASSDEVRAVDNRSSLLTTKDILRVVLVSLAATGTILALFLSEVSLSLLEAGAGRAKVMSFLFLWSAVLAVDLTRGKGRAAKVIAITTVLGSALLVQAPIFAQVFHLLSLTSAGWALVIAAVTGNWLWLRFVNRIVLA